MNKKNKSSAEIETLHQNLKLLHDNLRNKTQKKWNRVLPFDELLFDRWEKANFLNTKKDASIYHNSLIFGKVCIGKNTWIGPYTILDGSGDGIKIGDYCSISSGVQIYTHDTVQWSLTAGKATKETGKVKIGNYCYLGPDVLVSKGVTIGNRSIIGAQSFINKNIPRNSIVYGSPGKIVGKTIVKGKIVKKQFF